MESAYAYALACNFTKYTYELLEHAPALGKQPPASGSMCKITSFALSNAHDDDRAALNNIFSQQRLTGVISKGTKELHIEYRRKWSDDKYHWMLLSVQPVVNPYNNDVLGVALARCIDEQHAVQQKYEDAYIKASRSLDAFYKAIVTGIVKAANDEARTLLWASEAFFDTIGYTPEQFKNEMGNSLKALIDQDYTPDIAVLPDDAAGQHYTVTLCYRCRDGSHKWVQADGVLTSERYNGRAVRFIIYLDVTSMAEDQRKMKEDLYYRKIIDSTSPGVGYLVRYLDSPRRKPAYVSESLCRILGYTKEELVANCYQEYLADVYPDDRELLDAKYREISKKRPKSAKMVFRALSKNGAIIWMAVNAIASKDFFGKDAYVMTFTEINEHKKLEEALRLSGDEYRLAASGRKVIVARYDVAAKTLSTVDKSQMLCNGEHCILNFPNTVIESGFIPPESHQQMRNFFGGIGADKPTGELTVRCTIHECDTWYSFKYSFLRQRDMITRRATVVIENVTEQRKMELAYTRWKQTVDSMAANSYFLFEYNLTSRTCEHTEGELLSSLLPEELVDKDVDKQLDYIGSHADFGGKSEILARDPGFLLALFERGERELKQEFRITRRDGAAAWLSANIQMVEAPLLHEIQAVFIYKDITAEKKRIETLRFKAESDALTGAYNRDTFIKLVSREIRSSSGCRHALLMVDIDHFKSVNDTYGHTAGDSVLNGVVALLKKKLRAEDIVGRMGGDEFMVFMKDVPSADIVKGKAEMLCGLVADKWRGSYGVTVSIGISLCPYDGATFKELYASADKALYHAKRMGRNKCVACGETDVT